MSTDQQVRQMMEELGRALVQAIGKSSDVSAAVRHIRHQGFSLHLVLNCDQDSERGAQMELMTRQHVANAPVFRLNSHDVGFLKSLGIDPTRSARGRRSS